ncbi:MAG: hypothetical protein HOK41_08795 [Nitrospina sp.]|jgi:hypothetical protein|nr:hypothetical protein [Nitrospina sp.]MBT6717166.1 hypothetical protein [Nitrospina sp.]
MLKPFTKPFFIFVILFWMISGATAFANEKDYERAMRVFEDKYKSKFAILDAFERFSWKGDFRLRYQHDQRDQAVANTLDRNQLRLRFRLGSTVHLYEDLDIGFRIVTGTLGSATSSNATLDSGFGNKSFNLDRAFFKWTPKPFVLQAGKFPVPFRKSQLIWDGDVNVEGIAEQFSHKMGNTNLKLILGQFIIDEINPGDDIKLFAYQGILEQQTGLGKFSVALAYYDYADHEDPVTAPTGGTASNNTLSEVKVVDLMGMWSGSAYGKPLKFFAEYAKNTGALAPGQPDLDAAWHAGFAYGKSGQKFADWDIKLLYRVVQTEAVLDALADSDFQGGRNNGRGVKVSGSMGLRKGIKLTLTYYNTQQERGAIDEQQKFQSDLIFKF